MRFYEIETFGDEVGRHALLAISDLETEKPIPPYIWGGNRVLVPEQDIAGLADIVLGNTTAQQLLDENSDHIVGKIPILVHTPEADEWRIQFGPEEAKLVRINQLKDYFHSTITSQFPEWKQLNIDSDERVATRWISDWTGIPYLDVSAWLFNKLWPADLPWHEQVRQPKEIRSKSLDGLVDEVMDFIFQHRSEKIGYIPDRFQVEGKVRDASYGLGVRYAINALRYQSSYLESEINKLTKIDDIIHYNVPAVWW